MGTMPKPLNQPVTMLPPIISVSPSELASFQGSAKDPGRRSAFLDCIGKFRFGNLSKRVQKRQSVLKLGSEPEPGFL